MNRYFLAVPILGLSLVVVSGGSEEQEPPEWPATILMTNDDGIDTPGIRVLAETMATDANVYVVAPAGNRSGSGGYMGVLSGPIAVDEITSSWGSVAGAYATDGYPADAILWGVKHLLAKDPPDLVISGINDGANAGDAWFVSGTIGAARTAAFFGIPALAVSGYSPEDAEAVRQVADWVARFARSPMVRGLDPGEYLLVNMPAVRMDDVTGIVIAPLDLTFLEFGVRPTEDSPGSWTFAWSRAAEPDPAGDWAALRRTEIVITPMRVGEMIPSERFEGMLGDVPTPAGQH